MPREYPLDRQWQQLMALCRNESAYRAGGTHPRLLKHVSAEIDHLARVMGFSERRIETRDFRAEREGSRILRIISD